MYCKKILGLLMIFSLLHSNTYAQRWGISAGVGKMGYNGDLSYKTIPSSRDLHETVSLGLFYEVSEKINLKTAFTIGKVSCSDKYSTPYKQKRNLDFESNIVELAVSGEYMLANAGKTNAFIPYVTGGIGVFHFNPTTIDKNGVKVNLHDIGTEGQYLPVGTPNRGQTYNLTQINILYGFGCKYAFNNHFAMAVDLSARYLFTDYLDDVGASGYVAPAAFDAAGQTAAKLLSYRGDELNPPQPRIFRGVPTTKDSYGVIQISFLFKLGNNNSGKYYACPRVR